MCRVVFFKINPAVEKDLQDLTRRFIERHGGEEGNIDFELSDSENNQPRISIQGEAIAPFAVRKFEEALELLGHDVQVTSL